MNELPKHPEPPEIPPAHGVVILGRFQPFHKGHELLINSAVEWREKNNPKLKIILAIGSSNRPETLRNPWTAEERKEMIEAWALDGKIERYEIVAIPDIDDPPNWVSHAEMYHGGPGVLFTSDMETAELYRSGRWEVIASPLESRELFEGWRVRETARMMSTIAEVEAVREVLGATVPMPVIDYLVGIDGLKRLAFLGEGGEPVG